MLTITVPEQEFFDSKNGMFYTLPSVVIKLEHSLLSVSKWESKWKKSFFSKEAMSDEEYLYYVRCMTINQVDPKTYYRMTKKNHEMIAEYIKDPMSATTFMDLKPKKPSRETITSELIYYWMVTCQIPFEAEKWHLNRLLTLIRICDVKNNEENNKMSKKDIYKHNRALNAARRAKHGTRG